MEKLTHAYLPQARGFLKANKSIAVATLSPKCQKETAFQHLILSNDILYLRSVRPNASHEVWH